jgi:hypothetical protein
MATEEKIDWSECSIVEVKSGVQERRSCAARHADAGRGDCRQLDYGVSVAEIAEQFEVPPDRVDAILTYAKSHRVAHRVR